MYIGIKLKKKQYQVRLETKKLELADRQTKKLELADRHPTSAGL
jgi:hypothetical protein